MNIKQAQIAIEYCRRARITPHFIGKHGIGKSAMVYQWAAANGYEVAEIRVGQMADAGDLIGLQEFIKDQKTGEAFSTRHILPDWFMKATKPGAKVVIFIDELNRGAKDLLQAIFELVYDLSLKGTKISEESFIVAASNPPTENYAVLDFSDSAFSDRFCHIKLEPTHEEFLAYCRKVAPTSSMADFIQDYPQMLEDKDLKDFDLDFVKPSRRSNIRITMLEAVKAPAEIELELFMGIVGFEAANTYLKYRETNFKSIRGEDVLNNYKKVSKDVKSAVKKGRSDLLGTVNQELDQLFKNMTSLTQQQAENLADFGSDLSAEHAYALGIIVKNNSHCTLNISDVDEKTLMKKDKDGNPVANAAKLGLFAHKRFVERVFGIKFKRDEIKVQETNV